MFAAKNTAAPSGEAVYIESVFSTYLYTGTGASQTITNGIDLAGKGGMVWVKCRSVGFNHVLADTVRGNTKVIYSDLNAAQDTFSTGISSFNSNGFSIGSVAYYNESPERFVSWTFREQPKFFDVVTYTGNGSNRTISHNLGSVPGCILIKRTDSAADWQVYHRSLANTEYLVLNGTAAKATGTTRWNSTTPTSTEFSLGTDSTVNANSGTYVAYLFAHNAGGFGASGSDNVISCGSYTGTGAAGNNITLGYEPQWLMVKRSSSTGNWVMLDVMRGFSESSDNELYADLSLAEGSGLNLATPQATGFQLQTSTGNLNASGSTYIYIAIRRGPMKTPTSGTQVYNAIARSGTSGAATVTGVGFAPDLALTGSRTGTGHTFIDRLRGTPLLISHLTNAEATYSAEITSFNMDGISLGNNSGGGYTNLSGQTYIPWYFRRAPGFFDVVCYTGTGSTSAVNHNLGVQPELIIYKSRLYADVWVVHTPSLIAQTKFLWLQSSAAEALNSNQGYTASGTPTATTITPGTDPLNQSGFTYVAYLFASVTGVSKVGSYTGNGSSQTINCGFTAGARFILIKRTSASGGWLVWDTARGIVSGNDPYLALNSTASEVTTDDSIDPDNSGFIVNQVTATNINVSAATYIFLAIA